jgi:hypothetical protein
MATRTCAACDSALDADAIEVLIGGKPVEVCCEPCAVALKEADQALRSEPAGRGVADAR